MKRLCAVASRNFSHAEWRKYLGDRIHGHTCLDLPEDTLGALENLREGEILAHQGKTDQAIGDFTKAWLWDARLVPFDIEARVAQLAKEGGIGEDDDVPAEQ